MRPAVAGVVRAVVSERWIALLVVAAAVFYAAYAVLRHDHYRSGYDLGIFTQAVWHYSQFQAPGNSIRGVGNLLGDHFHPILVVLAPLFWVWSDARTLLIAQAALAAASIVPVYLFARPRIGRWPAHLLAFAYASFWGLGVGVGYEFHEVAFAPLLIALTILLIDRRRWTGYWITLGLLLCVKEDLSVLVCFLGLYLLTMREFRRGLTTVAAGIAWYELTTRILIPHFAHGTPFGYWTYQAFGSGLGDAIVTVLQAPWKPFVVAFDNPEKTQTMLYLVLPFLGLTFCSRLALLTVPLMAERFLSVNTQLWSPSFHYSLAIAPVLAMGAAAGLGNLVSLAGARLGPRLALTGTAGMIAAGTLVSGVMIPIPIVPWRLIVKAEFYRQPAFAGAVGDALAHIPSAAAVVAPDFLVAHLAARSSVYELNPGLGNPPGYLVTGLVDAVGNIGEHANYRDYQADVARRLLLYQPTFYEDGWIVLRLRTGGVNSGTNGVLTPIPRVPADQLIRSYTAWEVSFATTLVQVLGCIVHLQHNDPGARACLARPGSPFLAAHARLDHELATLLPRLVDGCAQLGALARMGADQVAVDIQNLRRVDITHALAALVGFAADVNDRDLAGRLTRFVMLCYPRPLPAPIHLR